MGVPLSYNLRSLVRRKTTSLFTVLGIALVVAVFIITQSLARGIRDSLAASGHELNFVILRQGSTAETTSFVPRDAHRRISQMEGIERVDRVVAARRVGIEPDAFPDSLVSLAAPELLTIVSLRRPGSSVTNPLLVRGVTATSFLVRPPMTIVQGRLFRPGLREAIAPTSLLRRFDGLDLGQRIRIGRSEFTIVGHFDAGDNAFNSEVWVDGFELGSEIDRGEWSAVTFRAQDQKSGQALSERINADPTLSFKVMPELEYYREQMISAAPISILGGFLATMMSIGAVFAAMNTMYASIASRTREIGTLKVLGFRPGSIERAFFREALALGLLGGILGCLIAYPINGLATGTANYVTFSELAFRFRITPDLMATGLIFALVIGGVGGWLPARAAARKPVMVALREL
jgi:putative ABC transport system permease protein